MATNPFGHLHLTRVSRYSHWYRVSLSNWPALFQWLTGRCNGDGNANSGRQWRIVNYFHFFNGGGIMSSTLLPFYSTTIINVSRFWMNKQSSLSPAKSSTVTCTCKPATITQQQELSLPNPCKALNISKWVPTTVSIPDSPDLLYL